MNRDLKEQLARAFGLGSESEVDTLISRLRAGDAVDAQVLRKGCLALVDQVRDTRATSDERLKVALEASNVGLWDWDLTTRLLFVDHTYFGILGLEKGDQVLPIDDLVGLVHPEDLPAFSGALRDAETGKQPSFQIQHRMRHADGRWVWLETYGNVTQLDAGGRAVRMTGTHTNITDRKQLERALSNTLRVMRALLETLPLPVIIRDTERRVTLVNAAWEKMLGISRQDIVGKQIEAYQDRVLSDNHRQSDEEVLTHKRALRYETVVHGIDGTNYDVIVAKTPLVAEDGTVTGLAAVVTDISEQKRTSEVLEKARVSAEAAVHAKSRFLANMSRKIAEKMRFIGVPFHR